MQFTARQRTTHEGGLSGQPFSNQQPLDRAGDNGSQTIEFIGLLRGLSHIVTHVES